MKSPLASLSQRLFSLDTEGVELLLACQTFNYATVMLDKSGIAASWSRALQELFPLPIWTIWGAASGIALGATALASMVWTDQRILKARMAAIAGAFIFYSAVAYAQHNAGGSILLYKNYLVPALFAFAVYLMLYLERHRLPKVMEFVTSPLKSEVTHGIR